MQTLKTRNNFLQDPDDVYFSSFGILYNDNEEKGNTKLYTI